MTIRGVGRAAGVLGVIGSCALASWACGRATASGVQPAYDAAGKLTRLAADQNGDGRIDTWTYMDGSIPLRTEQDLDGDGRIERWEFSRPDASTEKVAISRRGNGKPDIWTYLDLKGQVVRIEMASLLLTEPDGRQGIERAEFYEAGKLIRVEEDTDADGRVDKWERHDGPVVLSVEFDQDRDGKPDERITFGPDGAVTSRQKIGGNQP